MSSIGTGIFTHPLAVSLALGIGASLVGCLALVLTERWHGRYSHDSTEGVQKFHARPVPRIGGVAIFVAYVAMWPTLPPELRGIWGLIGTAAVPAFVAGLAEDVTKRAGVRVRLAATMVAGMIFAILTGYTMHNVDLPGIDVLLAVPAIALLFTGFAMSGVANAINIIDGFNGLASGTLLILFAAFAWVAHQVGDPLVLSLALLFAALVLGFFLVNFPFGAIFLGDGGAYFGGFLLAVLGVLLPTRNPEVSAWAAILICAYPVIETLASMRRKAKRDGYSVGVPDRVHFHMLVHRTFARRLLPDGPQHLRNPATSLVVWLLPLMTTGLVMLSYDNVFFSALFFFLTVGIYSFVYRIMSLNPPRLPRGRLRRS